MGVFAILWYIITTIQMFLGYGTAYRLTKNGGDNGIALFGWLLLMWLVAMIPGLGIYIWLKYQDGYEYDSGMATSNSGDYSGGEKRPSWLPPQSHGRHFLNKDGSKPRWQDDPKPINKSSKMAEWYKDQFPID